MRGASTFCSAAALAIAALGGNAFANPQGGNVVAGSATIVQTAPNRIDINQATSNAVIDWTSFSIGAGEVTRFNQPSAAAHALNRVTGTDPSRIAGTLSANGRVTIVNRSGILFLPGAQIDVAGLIASTSNISNTDFMAGRLNFSQPGNGTASVVNEGTITVAEGGFAAFVAPSVRNSGVIEARLGKVTLASGEKFTVDLYGDGLVNLALADGLAGQVARVDNTGRITADGGTIVLTVGAAQGIVDGLINLGGVVQARRADSRDGKVILESHGSVVVTGIIDASEAMISAIGPVTSGTQPTITIGEIAELHVADQGTIRAGTVSVLADTAGSNAIVAVNGAALDVTGSVSAAPGGGTVITAAATPAPAAIVFQRFEVPNVELINKASVQVPTTGATRAPLPPTMGQRSAISTGPMNPFAESFRLVELGPQPGVLADNPYFTEGVWESVRR